MCLALLREAITSVESVVVSFVRHEEPRQTNKNMLGLAIRDKRTKIQSPNGLSPWQTGPHIIIKMQLTLALL